MTKRLLVFSLALALGLCVWPASLSAHGAMTTASGDSTEVKETPAKEPSKANLKLKRDMEKLLADAKAGRVAPRQQQFPRAAKNNLSTTAKIGIIAAIGGAITLIVVFHELSKD
jgi:hypothetical protein